MVVSQYFMKQNQEYYPEERGVIGYVSAITAEGL